MKLAWIVLLFLMVPPIAFCGPGAATEVCIADDHVSFNCHDGPPGTDCGGKSGDGQGDERSSCVDIAAPTGEAQTVRAGQAIPPPPLCFVLLPSFVDLNPTAPTRSRYSGDDPPPFCARSHCCSIALRC